MVAAAKQKKTAAKAAPLPTPPQPPNPPSKGDGPVSSRTRKSDKKKETAKKDTAPLPNPTFDEALFGLNFTSGNPGASQQLPTIPPGQWSFAQFHADTLDAHLDFIDSLASEDDTTSDFPIHSMPAPLKAAQKRRARAPSKIREEVDSTSPREKLLQSMRLPAEPTVERQAEPELYALQELTLAPLSRPCPCCKVPMHTNGLDAINQANNWLEKKRKETNFPPLQCQHCNKFSCLECGAAHIGFAHKCKSTSTSKLDSRMAIHLIWLILCALDEHSDRSSKTESPKSNKRKRPIKQAHNVLHQATPMGTGYGGDHWGDPHAHPFIHANPKEPTKLLAFDGVLSRGLVLLCKLLPIVANDPSMSTKFPSYLPRLLNDHLMHTVADLLRNDSLQEVTKRVALYRSLLQFSKMIAEIPQLAPLFTEARTFTLGQPLLFDSTVNPVQQSTKAKGKRKAVEPTTIAPLAQCIQSLGKQCKSMQERADRDPDSFSDSDAQEMLNLCIDMEMLVALAPDVADPDAESSGASEEEVWFRENCVAEVEDNTINKSSSGYFHSLKAQAMKDPMPGRMKRLLLEMATLKSSLPAGIFVRHAMSRPDIMKVLIVGPQDTPYANGVFEFDFFCRENYPDSPPLVQFKTTGGGTEGMNPNLYPDGKVCLSLLGTWQGEPWRPGESTLLQVLLSLQAMVFCAEPYYNEPGWSHNKNEPASSAYNANLYRATTTHAIMEPLETLDKRAERKTPKDAEKVALWDDVLVHHFANNADLVLATCREWRDKVEEREAQRKMEIEKANANNAAAGSAPPPLPWATHAHYGSAGKLSLADALPRVQNGLKALMAREVREWVVAEDRTAKEQAAVKSTDAKGKSGVKQMMVQAHDDDEEEVEESSAKKKRKTTKEVEKIVVH